MNTFSFFRDHKSKITALLIFLVLIVAGLYIGLKLLLSTPSSTTVLTFLSPDLDSETMHTESRYFSNSPNLKLRDYLLGNDLENASRLFGDLLYDLEHSKDSCDKINHLFNLATLVHKQDYAFTFIRVKTELYEVIIECHMDNPDIRNRLLASISSNIALGYLRVEKPDSAYYFFNHALQLQNEVIRMQTERAENHHSIRNELGFHETFIFDNELNQARGVYIGNLGRSQLALGDTLSAIDSFQESVSINGTSGFRDGHATFIALRLANLLTEMDRLDEAYAFIEEASALISRVKAEYDGLLGHQRYQEALWKYHDKMGNTEEAYNAYRIYSELNRQELNSKILLQRLNVYAEYQLLREKQLSDLLFANFQTIVAILFLGLMLLLLLGIIIYLILQNKERAERYSKELKVQNSLISSQNRQLIETGERVQQLTLTLAHDLRSPLTGIRLLSQFLLEEENLSDQTEETIRAIQLSTSQIGELIDQVLLTDCEAIEKPPHFKITQIQPFLKRCITPILSQVRKKDQKLYFECDEEARATIDSSKICRVVQNLAGNASKHNPEGTEIRIEVRCSDKDSICLTVSDNGIGIPQNKLDSLFDFKKNFDDTDSVESPSFGMGLYIVHKVVTLHDGELQVESSQNGSTFRIYLPVTRSETALADPDPPKESAIA